MKLSIACKKSSSATRIEREERLNLDMEVLKLAKRVPQQRGLKVRKG